MRSLLVCLSLLSLSTTAKAVPVVYTDEALFTAELAALTGSTIFESFEDDTVWADSRNSIVSPGSAPSIVSQGVLWTSNYTENELATGTVGGSAPDGAYAVYSLPHGMTVDSGPYCDYAEDPNVPSECYQNDGLKVESDSGGTLYAFGGRIDTANSGKVTFLLDGVDINGNDTDNIDNWQREGDFADNWDFVGVIDPDGFLSAELRELRGKDFQQVLLFADGFTIQMSAPPGPTGDLDGDGDCDVTDLMIWQRDDGSPTGLSDWQTGFGSGGTAPPIAATVPEPSVIVLLALGFFPTMLCRNGLTSL